MDLEVRPLHILQQFLDEVDTGLGLLTALGLGLGGCRTGHLPASPHRHYPGRLSSMVLASSPNAAGS